jgi:hypothetical protein
VLIHNRNGSHNPVFDQSNKFVNSAIAPAQVLSAPSANAERPGVSRKPGVFERRFACVAATDSLRKGDDLEANPLGICESKLISPFVREAIPFSRDMVETPCAKPIACSIAGRERGPVCKLDFSKL